MNLLLIIGCLLGVVALVAVVTAVILLLMQSHKRDVVSSARQGWISRRSEQDEEGW